MWFTTPSTESLTRPRIAVAVVSAIAAISAGYYAYQSLPERIPDDALSQGLHRSNAIRRTRRRSRRTDTVSSASSGAGGDENVDASTLRPLGDAETIVDGGVDDFWNDPSGLPSQRTGHNIVNLLFRASEDNARRNGCVHRGCQCNACGAVPIRGVRYRCANCADFDLCETCEAQGIHTKTHIFYKIRVPAPPFGPRQMQPVWYPGDPETCRRSLPRVVIAKLSRETGFERPELEAFWEQWTFMANTEWRDDPDDLGVAMDRKTFERCLVPTGGSRHAAPNLIHDRMFSFYDSNNDDLIGFAEFLHGLSYRKRKDKLRKVFEGYDIDADGFVDRRDFLRMFRAYYVLYKQMHKDILDGLEDQLLAGAEAQGLVKSRQPLSSLFGREGRVPAADEGPRVEGKAYQSNGSVVLDEGIHRVTKEDGGDTADRQDILTSLFAYDTSNRTRSRFVSGADSDNNWRTVRRLPSHDADRTYLVSLLDPPSTLEELPDLLAGNHALEEYTSAEEDDENDDDDDRSANGDRFPAHPPSESDLRATVFSQMKQQAPKLEKRRRDMARRQLHERWKRRQFYLDEEEGGAAPDDWETDEDILTDISRIGESSKSTEHVPVTSRSRSSSKVRFVEDMDDFDIRSNPSTSSRSIPERWGGMEIPDAERDAGKEILYQVTQQAFNELLDTIFKKSEDAAIEVAETKQRRQKYRHLIDTIDAAEAHKAKEEQDTKHREQPREDRASEDKSLGELLHESGYSLRESQPRNAVELDNADHIIYEEEEEGEDDKNPPSTDDYIYRDPTMPQFRPNVDGSLSYTSPSDSSGHGTSPAQNHDEPEPEPSIETLRHWKLLELAEEEAIRRGGWGKLCFDEFEEIYKSQEEEGNRLDYLGSWIDFCIP